VRGMGAESGKTGTTVPVGGCFFLPKTMVWSSAIWICNVAAICFSSVFSARTAESSVLSSSICFRSWV